LLQLQGGIKGTMGLTNPRQHLPHSKQMLFQLELAIGAQPLQVDQAAPDTLDAVGNELVRLLLEHRIGKQLTVDVRQQLNQFGEVVAPGPVGFGISKQGVNAGLAGFLVFQQLVGHATVGRDHKNPLVEVALLALANNDIVAHGLIITHGSTADFLDGMLCRCHVVAFAILRNVSVGWRASYDASLTPSCMISSTLSARIFTPRRRSSSLVVSGIRHLITSSFGPLVSMIRPCSNARLVIGPVRSACLASIPRIRPRPFILNSPGYLSQMACRASPSTLVLAFTSLAKVSSFQ